MYLYQQFRYLTVILFCLSIFYDKFFYIFIYIKSSKYIFYLFCKLGENQRGNSRFWKTSLSARHGHIHISTYHNNIITYPWPLIMCSLPSSSLSVQWKCKCEKLYLSGRFKPKINGFCDQIPLKVTVHRICPKTRKYNITINYYIIGTI